MKPIVLQSWRVFRVTRNTNGLQFIAVGYTPHLDDVMISGSIKTWDALSRIISTDKQERIKLEGEPKSTRDTDNAWDRWISRHGIRKEPVDVSGRYYRGKVTA